MFKIYQITIDCDPELKYYTVINNSDLDKLKQYIVDEVIDNGVVKNLETLFPNQKITQEMIDLAMREDCFNNFTIEEVDEDDYKEIIKFQVFDSPYHMTKIFAIYAGLSGGFGGREFIEFSFEQNILEAENYAYLKSIEIYEQYEGYHGLRTVENIMEEDGLDEEEAIGVYEEERDSWLDYEAIEVS